MRVATGEVLWDVAMGEAEEPTVGPPLTDGLRVLVPSLDTDGDVSMLTAYNIRSGDREWEGPLPDGVRYLTVLGDRIAATGRAPGGEITTILE